MGNGYRPTLAIYSQLKIRPQEGGIITQVTKSSANQTKRAIEASAVAMED